MKNKGKLYSIALALTALVFVFSILISTAASAAQVTRIGSGSDPAIYGSKVVWTNDGVIHIYDLTAKTDTTVSSSEASHPAIYGNKLVWHDESSGVPRLTVYDIPSGARSYITRDIDSGSIPAMYGNRIVWSANSSVYMRDISISIQTRIASGEGPDIYDTKITYSYDDGDMPRIYVYDVITKETITASPYSGYLSQPHIYGNKVIWSNFYTRMGYISMYDIVMGKTIDVTSDNTYSGDPENPDAGDDTGTHTDINGDKIAYAKSGNDQFGSAGVYVYNISTGQSTQVANYDALTTPDVYGSTIVWGIEGDSGVNDNGIYMSDLSAINTLPPVAAFTSNVTSGTVPLVVKFTDTSTGGVPTSWHWDTGDGIYSKHAMNATHTFTKPGVYNVTLTVANEAGSSTVTKPNYITVISPQAPVADFSANVTSGAAPLVVLFTDISTEGAPNSWYWDFGDGSSSSWYGGVDSKYAMNATHTFTKPGNYTISLTVGNSVGNSTATKLDYIVATDLKAPVANFSSNVTKGYAPLSVLFTDLSQNATSRNWDIWNDGIVESTDASFIYVFTSPGTYPVSLTSVNSNGTSAAKSVIITVMEQSNSKGGSSGDSHSSSGGSGGGGGGGSPEPVKNVEVKEISQAFITNGKTVKFDFTKNATCVVYVSFDSKRTFGKTTTIAEMLKGKSALVPELPSGEVYKSFNVWVGNGGVATSKNIENPVVCFKIEKSWVKDKNIDKPSITLNRYSDKKWEQFPVSLSGEDDKFLYFTARTSGFSSFAITGTARSSEETVTGVQVDYPETITNNTSGKETQTEQKEISSTPNFEIYYGIASLFGVLLCTVFLCKRK